MALSAFKTSLAVLLALVFGASQVCACAGQINSSAAESNDHSAQHVSVMDEASHKHVVHQKADRDHNTPCDNESCTHCSAPAVIKAAISADLIVSPFKPDAAKFISTLAIPAAYTLENFAPLVRRGLAWLDPPPTTPITLKTRLLN